ncbi:amino acid adenylation domain-containing protein [Streptomyces sp. NPDC004610]|uniref:non-ribosomal peptide synthetase n=1 Tax=unclassified Streptomyces TaxID=2593676 RepID=UPI0033BCA143
MNAPSASAHPVGDPPVTAALVADLLGRDVALQAQDGRLRLRAPGGVLEPHLVEAVRAHKDALLAELSGDTLLPLSDVQRRLWFLQQLDPSGTGYVFAQVTRLTGPLAPDTLIAAAEEVLAAHPGLRAGFHDLDGTPVQRVPLRTAPEGAVRDGWGGGVAPQGAVPGGRGPGIGPEGPVPDRQGTGVTPEGAVPDWRQADEPTALARLRDRLIRPFDLSAPPLLRTMLARTGDTTWLWGVAFHHLVADGWTHALFQRELAAAYQRLLSPAPAPAPAPGAPHPHPHPAPAPGRTDYADNADYTDYTDFVLADAERRDHPDRDTALTHWTERLRTRGDGEIAPDTARPALRTHTGARVDLDLPAEVTRQLRRIADDAGGTLFAALLAVHGTFLHRHTGSDRNTVGTPHANRPEERFHDVMGCFVSTLPLTADVSGDPTFRELTARTAAHCLTAWDHADFSYARLVDRLAPERDTSRNPLFQTFLALQDIPGSLELPGVEAAPVAFDTGVSQFELEVHLTPRPDGTLRLTLLHNRDLFTPGTARRLAARWAALATAAAHTPDAPLRDLTALTPDDTACLGRWETGPDAPGHPHHTTVDDLFAAQAARTPGRTAVTGDGGTLTYAELDTTVDRLAALLRTHNPDRAPVGVLLPRTVDLPAALLACVRAGAPFLPIPLDAPPAQVDTLVRRNGIGVAWAVEDTAAALPPDVRPLDPRTTADPAPERRPVARGTNETNRKNETAYILHTSGSTGEPKGVAVGHPALLNLLTTMAEAPGITEDDTLLAVTAPFFDIALLELFLPLITGARLAVATDEEARDPGALAAAIGSAGATVMQATPSTWRMLTDTGWRGDPNLSVWSGGEPLARDLAERLLRDCRALWNLYGPTETTIWSTRHRVEGGTGPVPIGGPVAGTGVHLLDGDGRPVPPGVPGELFISGRGLAHGYVGRPDLTAERFVPVTTVSGARIRAYRTGDVARFTSDGDLVCLGRTDDQLKVRGQRVEPGEIEAALVRHPAVREAVVVTTDDGLLVAHLRVGRATDDDTAEGDGGPDTTDESGTANESGSANGSGTANESGSANSSQEPDDDDLTAFLAGRLRAALVPQRFVVHTALPRTANGKVDRASLRTRPLPAPGDGDDRPRTATEELVVSLYSTALGGVPVGRADDFFRLGGHSLSAVRLLHQLAEHSSVRVPLHDFLADGRASSVAALIDRQTLRATEDLDDIALALALLEGMTDDEADALLTASLSDPDSTIAPHAPGNPHV